MRRRSAGPSRPRAPLAPRSRGGRLHHRHLGGGLVRCDARPRRLGACRPRLRRGLVGPPLLALHGPCGALPGGPCGRARISLGPGRDGRRREQSGPQSVVMAMNIWMPCIGLHISVCWLRTRGLGCGVAVLLRFDWCAESEWPRQRSPRSQDGSASRWLPGLGSLFTFQVTVWSYHRFIRVLRARLRWQTTNGGVSDGFSRNSL